MSVIEVDNGLAPIGSHQPNILILGSMPSVASLRAQAYYAHPRNAFWKIIATVYATSPDASYSQRCALLETKNIKVWDVIQAAKRDGSLDSAIEMASIRMNDFSFLQLPTCKVSAILCNGTKAFALFNKHVVLTNSLTQPVYLLPSTSPAHAAMSFEQKLTAWQKALNGGV